jgi:hypothetical protein
MWGKENDTDMKEKQDDTGIRIKSTSHQVYRYKDDTTRNTTFSIWAAPFRATRSMLYDANQHDSTHSNDTHGTS